MRSDGDGRYDVFCSYNSADREIVEALAGRLSHANLSVWLDTWCIAPGDDWQDQLAHGLAQSNACAVFVGAHGVGDWARQELKLALDRSAKRSSYRVVPVLLPGVPVPFEPTVELPPFLRLRSWLDLRSGVGGDGAIRRLVEAVKGLAPGPPEGSRATGTCPYPGLRSFERRDQDLFFGREHDIDELLEKVRSSRFLAVLGPSGSGKSSIVKAGLLPALSRGAVPNSDRWRAVTMRPGAQPLAEAAAQLTGLGHPQPTTELLDALRRDARTLALATSVVRGRLEDIDEVVWVVDQFEELFTIVGDGSERQFIANLVHAAAEPSSAARVVVTMRADFYARCAAFPELGQLMAAHQHLVSPLDLDGWRAAIEEPAWRRGLELQAGLVETLIADAIERPGGLPLLQEALVAVWERRTNDVLTLEGYVESGRVAGAVAKKADAVFESLRPEEQHAAKQVLLRLIQLGDGAADTRRQSSEAELAAGVGGEPIVREVVRRFVDARLFTTSRTVDGVAVVEVAHEALISEWPRLRAWLDDDREGLRVRQRLHQQAVEWVDEHRDESLLYRGAQLRLAIEVDERGQFELDGLERSFLDASRDEERRVDTLRLEAERERLRRAERDRLRRRVTIGLVSGLTIAMVLAAIALLQSREARRQRETARSLRLAAQSSVVAPRQLDLGLLLALQAQATSGSSEARGSLADALARTPRPARYLRLPAGTNLSAPLALAPAGTVVAGALSDGTVRLWDPRTGATLTTWPNHEHGAATALAFSGSGRQLALGFQDGTLGLRDVATGIARGGRTRHRESVESVTVVGESTVVSAAQDQPAVDEFGAASVRAHVLGSGTEPVSAVAASPDGQRLATSSDQAVRIWSLRTDAPLGAPLLDASSDFPPSRGTTLAWTPDGARLLVDAGRLQEFNGYNGVPTSAPSSLTGLSLVAVGGASVASALGQEVLLLDGRDTSTAPTVLTGHTSTVEGVAIARDGSTVVSSAADGVIVWYVDKLSPLATTLTGHESTVTAVAFIGDGSRLASAAQDGTVRQWDVRHRRELDPLETPQSVMSRLVYVRQARRLIGTTIDGHLVAWDAGSGAIVGRSASTTQNEAISALAVTNDGSIVATADRRGSVVLWNVATLRPTATMNQRAAVRGLAFSPNGKILASAGDDHTVRLWNVPAGTALGRPLAGHTGLVGAVAFSPDGKLLASGSDDRTVRLWDVRRRATNAVLAGHTDFVLNLRFSADGRTLASSGEDGNVILWDVEDHVAVGSPLPPASPSFIVDMDESTSGRLLAAAQGHDIVLWDIDESSWHAQACLTANRSLTEQERSQYLNRRAPVRVCGSG